MDALVLPIFLFLLAGAGLAIGMLLAPRLLAPSKNSAVKEMPYESGMDPIHDSRKRFDIRFHLVAIAFLLFDVELLLLYPWAVASRNDEGIDAVVQAAAAANVVGYDRWLVFGGVMFFTLLIVLGLVYEWRKGVLQWR